MIDGKESIRSIQADLLTYSFYVRGKLDEDHALRIGEEIESGTDIPPPVVKPNKDGTYTVIDGRHRIFARVQILNQMHVDCLVMEFGSRRDEVRCAVVSNKGTCRPLSRTDIVRTIDGLLASGVTVKDIKWIFADAVGPGALQKYLTTARETVKKRIVLKTISLLTENPKMTVEDAARYCGCPAERVQQALMKKGQRKGSLPKLMNAMTAKKFTHVAAYQGKTMQDLLAAYREGDATRDEVSEVVAYFQARCEGLMSRLREWQGRIYSEIAPAESGASPARYETVETQHSIVMRPKP